MLESQPIEERVRTLRVLLVDDEADVRTFYKNLLEESGFEVVTAASAHEGARTALQGTFDIAVVDERMPDARGLALLRWLHRRFPSMSVVLASAYADWEMYFRACAFGAKDVLAKEHSSKEFLRVVKHAVERTA